MAAPQTHHSDGKQGFVIGARNFAAITSVEGLKLSPEIECTLRQTESWSSEERKAEILRVIQGISIVE